MAEHGTNVWFDLMTNDVDAAIRFYTETLGWKTKRDDETYTMFFAGEIGVGGVMALPEEAKKMGAPPHWLAYTQVKDVDATVKQAEALGGQVRRAAFDVPDVGRIAILADPQGATFAVYKPLKDQPAVKPANIGQFSWAELHTTDYEAAWKFYRELFGWKHRDTMDMGEMGTYFMFNDGAGITQGGMDNMASKMGAPPHWLHYVNVDNCEDAIERIERAGGKVFNGPMEIPGNDVIAQVADAEGVPFAIYHEGKR